MKSLPDPIPDPLSHSTLPVRRTIPSQAFTPDFVVTKQAWVKAWEQAIYVCVAVCVCVCGGVHFSEATHVITGFLHGCKVREQQSKSCGVNITDLCVAMTTSYHIRTIMETHYEIS